MAGTGLGAFRAVMSIRMPQTGIQEPLDGDGGALDAINAGVADEDRGVGVIHQRQSATHRDAAVSEIAVAERHSMPVQVAAD
jgi:hypothetical protein